MERVFNYVSDQIKNKLEDSIYPEFLKWLEKLKNGRPSDQRLLCSLGIDIKYNLIDFNALVKIFENINYGDAIISNTPSHYFESALRDNQHLHEFGLENDVSAKNEETYVRIMTLDTFKSFFYNRIEGVADVKLANDKLLEEIKRGELKEVRMPNDGPPFRKCAWITPHSVIKEIIDECDRAALNSADIVTDRLGLNIDPDSNEYIMIKYPVVFNENTYQPCTLNVNWYDSEEIPGLFISYKKHDKFGRTRTRTLDDELKRLQERIHKPLPISYIYNISYLEKANDFHVSVDKIGIEALLRFL